MFEEQTEHVDHRLSTLRLMQLADSALPIGTTSHSCGLETLAAEGELSVDHLGVFLQDYLQEAGLVESVFCRAAHRLGAANESANFAQAWLELNAKLSALKPARESREASATLGRRLLHLVLSLESRPLLRDAATISTENGGDIHHCGSFRPGLRRIEHKRRRDGSGLPAATGCEPGVGLPAPYAARPAPRPTDSVEPQTYPGRN